MISINPEYIAFALCKLCIILHNLYSKQNQPINLLEYECVNTVGYLYFAYCSSIGNNPHVLTSQVDFRCIQFFIFSWSFSTSSLY